MNTRIENSQGMNLENCIGFSILGMKVEKNKTFFKS